MALFGILDRTLFWSVLQAIIGVLFVICAIDFLFALLDLMGQISEEFTFTDAIFTVMLQLPLRFIEFASVASLIGALVVLGLMASNAELVVMQAAGWSQMRILGPAIFAALVIAAFSLVLAELVVPATSLLKVNQGQVSSNAIWFRDGDTFAQVKRVTPSGQLIGVTLIDVHDNKSISEVRRAAGGVYDHTAKHWILRDVQKTVFGNENLTASSSVREVWSPKARPQELQFIARTVESLSIRDLISYIDYRQEQGLDIRRHNLNLWKTLLQPFANAVMVLLASSLVFGSMRMVSMGYRITVGLMFGLSFFYAQDLFGFVSLVYGVHPLICLAVPLLSFFGLALYRFRNSA